MTPDTLVSEVWIRGIAVQALRHGWVEVTVTAEMGRELLALIDDAVREKPAVGVGASRPTGDPA